MDEPLLPLFPLEIVLLPEELLPLHIFEERYKLMIGECLEAQARGRGQEEFGIVQAKDEEIGSVGCTAHIVRVIRKYDDGRMDILIQGMRRFEILFTNEEKMYLRGSVEFFDDDDGADLPPEKEAQRAIELFGEIRQCLANPADVSASLSRPYRRLSFRIAAPLPVDLDFKQQLLSVRNEAERLRAVTHVIEKLIPQLNMIRKARQKAGGNGNVHLGR